MRKFLGLKLRFIFWLWRKLVINRSVAPFWKFLLPYPEKEFLKFITSVSNITSKSQLYQDFLPLYVLGSKSGYFVEVGVGDGVNNSNSFNLEKEFLYKGILVEPNSKFHASIEGNRSATLYKCAAGSEDGSEQILVNTSNGEYSFIENRFVGAGSRRKSVSNQPIITKTLNSILTESGAPKQIDFLSIDVEGFELEVLAGINLNEWKFQVICIEHNYNDAKKEQIHSLLESFGYEHVLKYASQFDSFFVLPHLANNLTTRYLRPSI